MELYSEYITEKFDRKILIIPEQAFATYEIRESDCYIADMYVRPALRKTKIGSKIADEITKIAKSHGCKTLTAAFDLRAKGNELACTAILGYGFKFFGANDHYIVMKKEI